MELKWCILLASLTMRSIFFDASTMWANTCGFRLVYFDFNWNTNWIFFYWVIWCFAVKFRSFFTKIPIYWQHYNWLFHLRKWPLVFFLRNGMFIFLIHGASTRVESRHKAVERNQYYPFRCDFLISLSVCGFCAIVLLSFFWLF